MAPHANATWRGDTTKLRSEELSAARRRAPPQAVLTVLGGLERGRPIVPGPKPLVLGREDTCDVRLDGSGLSREHARLELQDDRELVLTDLGSTNGTRVNGERVERAVLEEGDRVQLGLDVMLSVDFDDASTVALRIRHYDQSVRDDLTGLYNRRFFEAAGKRELAYARRHREPVAVLAADLDHFKKVNDTYGHHAGDCVLKQVAQAMEGHFRVEDIVARFGGEEFVVLMRSASLEGAQASAERLRARIESTPIRWAGPAISVTASFGVAGGNGADLESLDVLMALADARLYGAKGAGRNRVL